jgi:hypothetical protein
VHEEKSRVDWLRVGNRQEVLAVAYPMHHKCYSLDFSDAAACHNLHLYYRISPSTSSRNIFYAKLRPNALFNKWHSNSKQESVDPVCAVNKAVTRLRLT